MISPNPVQIARPLARSLRPARPCAIVVVVSTLLAALSLHAQTPLHQEIDTLLAQDHPEGQAPIASDADFLRRSCLALHGVIPTAVQARAFLLDAAWDKRAKLIDSLIADPQFTKWMAVCLDVMLMERRGETHTKAQPWRDWIEVGIRTNKPWTTLVHEILSADGGDEKTRHTARWLLEREADPNALTRDSSRLFLGRDIGCSQCHDHPRIDDYHQRDYAGLQAFLGRTYLFRPDAEKPGFVGEQAAGETSYTSVFTKVGGETRPRLIGEPELAPAVSGEWLVPPNPKDKNLRPIPRQSRRAQLAGMLADGHHPAFRRNIANRLWALVFGRGLVEPLDLQHSANPPANPALLDLLAERIATMRFEIRPFVRELALTQAFQRALDVPPPPPAIVRTAAQRVQSLEQQDTELASLLAQAEEQVATARKQWLEAQRAAEPFKAEKIKQDAAVAAAKKAADTAAADRKKAEDQIAAKRDAVRLLAETAAKLTDAAAKAGGSHELTAAAQTFRAKSTAAEDEVRAAEKEAAKKRAEAEAKALELASSQKSAEAAKARFEEAARSIVPHLQALEQAEARKQSQRIRTKSAAMLTVQVKAALSLAQAATSNSPPRDDDDKAVALLLAARQTAERLQSDIASAPVRIAALEAAEKDALNAWNQAMTARSPMATALAEAAAKAAEAAAKFSGDAQLKAAAAVVKASADAAAADRTFGQKAATDARARADEATRRLIEARDAATQAKLELALLQSRLPTLEAAAQSSRDRMSETPGPVTAAREALTAAWSRSFASAELRPLTPEQLCWSIMQATGQLEIQRAAAASEWDSKNKPGEADKTSPARISERAVAIEKLFRDKLRGHEDQFIRSFGGVAGQPQTDFFATPEQALYFENGGVVRSWARGLADRLAALPETRAIAEELYLSTLTRMPADIEVTDLASTLASRPKSGNADVLADYAWALLTSVEFRFSH